MIKYIIFDTIGVVFTVGDDTNDLLIPYVLQAKHRPFAFYPPHSS